MRVFVPNDRQKKELEGLEYWLAEIAYLKPRQTRYDPKDYADSLEKARSTVEFCFDMCDKLHIPMWVQNMVIAFVDSGRWQCEYFSDFVKEFRV